MAEILVHPLAETPTRGVLTLGSLSVPCALGKGGITANKHEGDGATPLGSHPLRCAYYRADTFDHAPTTRLPLMAIDQQDGWCDDPADEAYNSAVTLPCAASHERLWRDDALYDLFVVLGYNDAPAVPGRGSAIFLHIARPGYAPTEGCVAVARDDLIRLVSSLSPGDVLTVSSQPVPSLR